MTDQFRKLLGDNIRADDGSDDGELRASLQQFGWSPKFPALKDERGVVLVGHRRLRLANELGIDPVVEVLHLGDGDEADAERLKIALISNVGFKPMTPKDRQRIAEHLYGERDWTMQRIAAALGVSKATISGDLANCSTAEQLKPAKTSANPKGAGRPKKAPKPKPPPKVAPAVEQRLAQMVLDHGKTHAEAEAEVGVSNTVTRRVLAAERAKREAEPEVDPATLSPSAQQKLAAAIRQKERLLQRALNSQFHDAVREQLAAAMNSLVAARYKELHAKYDRVLNRRRGQGMMSPAEYRLVLSCLHPDSRGATSERKIAEAFGIIQKHKLSLVSESVEPTPSPTDLPKTAAEWMEAKRKATEARRAKRNGSAVVNR